MVPMQARAAVEKLRFKVHELQGQQLTDSLLPPLHAEHMALPAATAGKASVASAIEGKAATAGKNEKAAASATHAKARVSALRQVARARTPTLASRVVAKYAQQYANTEEGEMIQYNAEKKAFEKQQQVTGGRNVSPVS